VSLLRSCKLSLRICYSFLEYVRKLNSRETYVNLNYVTLLRKLKSNKSTLTDKRKINNIE